MNQIVRSFQARKPHLSPVALALTLLLAAIVVTTGLTAGVSPRKS